MHFYLKYENGTNERKCYHDSIFIFRYISAAINQIIAVLSETPSRNLS